MKKRRVFLFFSVWALCSLTACSAKSNMSTAETKFLQTESVELVETDQAETLQTEVAQTETMQLVETSESSEEKETEMAERKLKMTVEGQKISIILYDTPTANALYEMLPMELNFSDYNGTEKIAYPTDELPTEGEPDGCDPDEGDFCLYAPWGNLCIFYQDFRYSDSLIKLGHVETGMDILAGMSGDFTATLEKAE